MPGDSILFKRGDTWRETLTVSSSGTTSNPITFGVYGSGLPPTVDGSDVVTSAGASSFEAHATLPNVWQKTLATEPRLVFFDGVKGQKEVPRREPHLHGGVVLGRRRPLRLCGI